MKSLTVWHGHSTRPSLPAGTARKASGSLLHGRQSKLIMQTTKNRKFPPVGNSLLYISLLSVAFGRVRPGGRTLFLFLWKLMLFRMQRAGHFCERPVQWSHTKSALQILHGPRSSASHRSFSTCPAVHPLILPAQHRLAETSIHLPVLLRRRHLRFLSDGSH